MYRKRLTVRRPSQGVVAAGPRHPSGTAEGAVGAEVDRGGCGIALEARALLEGPGHGVQQSPEWLQVTLGRGGQGLLDEVVAGYVDGVDPFHQVSVRAQGTPTVGPGVERRYVHEHPASGLRVAAGGRAEVAEEGRVVDAALLQQGKQVVDHRGGGRFAGAIGQTKLGAHPGRPSGTVLRAEGSRSLPPE